MYKHKCSICGKVFEHKNKTITQKIKKHIQEEHGITFKKYIVQTFFNGKEPLCKCGCGKKTNFTPKDALWNEKHGFGKYYSCGHVTRDPSYSNKETNWYVETWKNDSWVKEYYNEQFGIDVLQKSALEFINGKSARELSITYKIDVRTLRNAWVKLGLITNEDLKKMSQERQYSAALKRSKRFENKDKILPELFNILKLNPQKYNIRSLVRFYNEHNVNKITTNCDTVVQCLIDTYGSTQIYELLLFGTHSMEELKFLDILFFYFNKKIVKCGYRLQYSKNTKRNYYVYDFCIGNKILIEYDGNGYWHKSSQIIEHDKKKELFAINNGYIFLRVSKQEVKNPELILKIKQLLKT